MCASVCMYARILSQRINFLICARLDDQLRLHQKSELALQTLRAAITDCADVGGHKRRTHEVPEPMVFCLDQLGDLLLGRQHVHACVCVYIYIYIYVHAFVDVYVYVHTKMTYTACV